MNCPKCNKIVILEPRYKDHLCKNKECSLYMKGDVFELSNLNKPTVHPKIKEIIDNFDFNKVHKVMTFLKWEWRNEGIPSISKLKEAAKKQLEECMSKSLKTNMEYVIKSGGFCSLYNPNEDFLSLTFELTEWTD